MTARKWLLLIVVIGVVVLSVGYGLRRTRDWAKRDFHLTMDVEQIGQILLLFALEHGRMPADQQELLERGYLERRDDGLLYPGSKVIGQSNPYGNGPKDRAFLCLDLILIQYEDLAEQGKQRVTVPGATSAAPIRFAAQISDALENILLIPTNGGGVPSENSMPDETERWGK